jgi:predicted ester cyclase
MTTSTSHRVIDQYYEYFNTADIDGLLSLFSDNFTGHWGLGAGGDHALIRRQLGMWYRAVPDISAEVTQTVDDGAGWVATFNVVRGTHTGDLLGIPGSGRRFEMGSVDMYRILDNRIVEGHTVCDLGSLLIATGAVPGFIG